MAPAELELRMLGGLDVRRSGRALPQPPSKKTRALLAYLALTGRQHRREALCSLFWDITDDPRGALRWSLSKLRKQVDDDDVTRLQTDGERVGLELRGATVDVLEMRRTFADGKAMSAPTELLEAWCARCTGEVLEGLDLPDFDGYQAWLVAEREQTRRLHAQLLQALVQRTERTPERGFSHASDWIRVDPMNADARLAGMRLALAAGHVDEAKRQFQTARRLFAELDPAKETQLVASWQALRGTRSSSAPAQSPPMAAAEAAITPPEDRAPVSASGLPVLIGRETEQAELSAALERVVRTRRAELVLLSGEPGIGKSRLLHELLNESRARGFAVLDGAAFEGEAGRPYGSWIDALRKLSRTQLSEPARVRLAPLVEGADLQASSREALFSGIVDFLTQLAAAQATVLVVLDDVHWLDEGSAELLHYCARMVREQSVLFVLAAREAELHDQPHVLRVLRSLRRDLELRELAIGRLPEGSTRRLLEQLDREVDSARLFALSGGNPLFAIELARAGAAAERARTVADAVRDRLARLPAEAGDVLRWGAVLGTTFEPNLLAAVCQLSPEQRLDGLEELERRALIKLHGETYVFSHEIVRGVVYTDLSHPRRTLMHRRAGEALRRIHEERPSELDEALVAHIARHADLAGDHAQAASAYIAAGKRCLKLFASGSALAMVRKGLRHASELAEPARSRNLIELHDIQLWAQRPAAEDAFCTTVHALGETALEHGCVEHARLAFQMISYVRWESGAWDEARRQMLRAEQAGRAAEGTEYVEALAEAARCLSLLERDLGHAEALLAEARARAKQLGWTCAAIDDAEGLLRQHQGEVDAADALFDQAYARARLASQRYAEIQTLFNRARLNFDAGRIELALELSHKTRELADKTREGSEGPFARALVALCELALRGPQPTAALQDSLQELRVVDAKHRLLYTLSRSARLENAAARHSEAAALAAEALDIARLLECPSELVLSLVELARAQRALGDETGLATTRVELARDIPSRLSAQAQHARETWTQE